jgi:hypothetical protein
VSSWKSDREFRWRRSTDVFGPSVPCDAPVVPCGLPNPFAADAVAERLDQLYQDRIWWDGQKAPAAESGEEDETETQVSANSGVATGEELRVGGAA